MATLRLSTGQPTLVSTLPVGLSTGYLREFGPCSFGCSFFQMRRPNFYFHITTAYAILRHNGVNIGKKIYLGALPYREAT